MIHTRFFEDLGRVLFVLAMNDGAVQEREREIVERLIDEALLAHPGFSEETALKHAILTKISFRNALRDGLDGVGLVDRFSQDVIEHRDRIGRESLTFAWTLVKGLMDSWKGTNLAEQTQLRHLHQVLFGKEEEDGI